MAAGSVCQNPHHPVRLHGNRPGTHSSDGGGLRGGREPSVIELKAQLRSAHEAELNSQKAHDSRVGRSDDFQEPSRMLAQFALVKTLYLVK